MSTTLACHLAPQLFGTPPRQPSTTRSVNYPSPSGKSPLPTCRRATSPYSAAQPDACATLLQTTPFPASSDGPDPPLRVSKTPCAHPHRSALPSLRKCTSVQWHSTPWPYRSVVHS